MENKKLVTVYIVDDDANSIELLRRLLSEYSVEVVGTQTETQKAMDEIIELEPDLLFLDVEMPDMSGLDFCSRVRLFVKPEMKVVFYTGYDKYLLEALRRQAFDYMLKPASKPELAKIMTRYYENRLNSIQTASAKSDKQLPIVMIVNAVSEHTPLHLSDIAFFRFDSERRIWEVVRTDGTTNVLRHRTTAEIILNYSDLFVQIHKRYIVNIQKIVKIQDSTCLLPKPLQDNRELHISKNYRHDLMNKFYNM
jgi:two-component system LytT family response regulator